MTYQEYRDKRQAAYNALPVFYAFSDSQLEKEMNKRGIEDTDKIERVWNGGFCLKSDAQVIRDFVNAPDELPELMKDFAFAEDAIYYEMCNHEYAINWQADWDVCSCFGKVEYTEDDDELDQYFAQLAWTDATKRAYMAARSRYYKDARENDWI